MTSTNFPEKGEQAKRRSDGLIGVVYASDSRKDILTVRWGQRPSYNTLVCSSEQFFRDWELTGIRDSGRKGLVGAIVFPVIFGIGFYFWVTSCDHSPTDSASSPESQKDSTAVLENPSALHEKYGNKAAIECSNGADEYVKSVAKYEHKWEDTNMFDPKFDEYVIIYVAPGVTTSVSDKLLLQNGFGAFKRVKLFCNYDTQAQKVLRYWVVDNDE